MITGNSSHKPANAQQEVWLMKKSAFADVKENTLGGLLSSRVLTTVITPDSDSAHISIRRLLYSEI